MLAAIGIYRSDGNYGHAADTRNRFAHLTLGAQKQDVLRLIIGQGMILVVLGVAVGLAFAVGLTRLMTTLLFEVSPTDPLTLVAITLLLAVVALLTIICRPVAQRKWIR